jgi:hypothetical protein
LEAMVADKTLLLEANLAVEVEDHGSRVGDIERMVHELTLSIQ